MGKVVKAVRSGTDMQKSIKFNMPPDIKAKQIQDFKEGKYANKNQIMKPTHIPSEELNVMFDVQLKSNLKDEKAKNKLG